MEVPTGPASAARGCGERGEWDAAEGRGARGERVVRSPGAGAGPVLRAVKTPRFGEITMGAGKEDGETGKVAGYGGPVSPPSTLARLENPLGGFGNRGALLTLTYMFSPGAPQLPSGDGSLGAAMAPSHLSVREMREDEKPLVLEMLKVA